MNIEDYSKYEQFYADDIPPLLINLLKETDWRSCLDLGCGDGALVSALYNQGYTKDKSVYAVDSSAKRIDEVKKISDTINCIVADGSHTQLETSSIDLLISTQVIEHVDNDHDVVEEMQRLLCAGGFLYLTTVIKKRYGWYFYRCNGKWTLDPTHVREYTQDDQLLDILRSQGFEILINQKSLEGRPLVDAVLRRLKAPRNIYNNRLLKSLRAVRIPIPGYYHWELVCRKK